jgi:SAM-dependent methyltransferase
MDYTQILHACEANGHLISMVPVENIVELGWQLGLSENSAVLDLCCGSGETLKIWSEAFRIRGVGVDRETDFIDSGKSRLQRDRVKLIAGDVLAYDTPERFDVVMCTELSAGLFDSFRSGLAFLERFLKPGGKIVFGRLFSKLPNPPQELIDFDGALPTLGDINREIRDCAYYLTAMVSDTTAQWERYIMWSARRDLGHLRKSPGDEALAAWLDKWYRLYFEYRRQYEGWGLFGIEK